MKTNVIISTEITDSFVLNPTVPSLEIYSQDKLFINNVKRSVYKGIYSWIVLY